MNDKLLEQFQGNQRNTGSNNSYDYHFWTGYGSFGRGLQLGCGCDVCRHGWETARTAFQKVALGYHEGERHARQLTLFKLN